jgi:DeoR/GlpR family transcriptional regulator of sugar metabolism
LDVAVVLSRVENVQVYNIGGRVEPLHRAQQGNWALDELRRFRVDLALVSPSALSVEDGMFAPTTMEAAITATEIEIADRVWLLMEGSDIGRTGAVRVGGVAGVDHIFAAGGVATAAMAAVRDAGIPLSCTE